MASISKQTSGSWCVLVRRKGRSVSENFVRYEDAKHWAVDAERQIDRGVTPTLSRVGKLKTLSDLIDLDITDMKDVGKAPAEPREPRSPCLSGNLELNMVEVDRERIVRFGRARAKEGAGPVTLSMDVGLIKLVLQHAAAVHGLPVRVEPVDLGRVALKVLIVASEAGFYTRADVEAANANLQPSRFRPTEDARRAPSGRLRFNCYTLTDYRGWARPCSIESVRLS